MKKFMVVAVACLVLTGVCGANADGVGVRAGAGTDIDLGFAVGGGVNYIMDIGMGDQALEVGLLGFRSSWSEDSSRGALTYEEKSSTLIIGGVANFMVNYDPDMTQIYGLIGFGAAVVMVEWSQSSPQDTSLGTPLAGGGSEEIIEVTSAAAVINPGVGVTFGNGADIRFEIPIFMVANAARNASTFAPTFLLTGGFRF